jgi:hypothetical protein
MQVVPLPQQMLPQTWPPGQHWLFRQESPLLQQLLPHTLDCEQQMLFAMQVPAQHCPPHKLWPTGQH